MLWILSLENLVWILINLILLKLEKPNLTLWLLLVGLHHHFYAALTQLDLSICFTEFVCRFLLCEFYVLWLDHALDSKQLGAHTDSLFKLTLHEIDK